MFRICYWTHHTTSICTSSYSAAMVEHASREGFFAVARESQWWFCRGSGGGFWWRCRWCSRARVAGDVPSAAWLVVVVEGVRQIWFESNSDEVAVVSRDGLTSRWLSIWLRFGRVAQRRKNQFMVWVRAEKMNSAGFANLES